MVSRPSDSRKSRVPQTEGAKPAPKAYSYIRMSTKEQLEGDSLRRQLEKTRRYAEDHQLELVENYDDIGVSAFRGLNAEQGALRRFLDAIDNHSVPKGSYFIIESMDRLTRQTAMTAVAMMSAIIDKGIIIVTLDDGMEYSTETFQNNQYQLFIAIGAMMRAHDESRRKSGLLSDVWDEKRRQLRRNGQIITSKVPGWLRADKTTGTIEAIPARVAVVIEIFSMACSGYGVYSIAKTLNDRGEVAWGKSKATPARPKGNIQPKPVWRDSYIKKILANRAVLGEFQPRRQEVTEDNKKLRIADGDVVRGYYPTIIEEGVFREANLALQRRRNGNRGRKGANYSNIFTGLLHCAKCGSGMRFIDKGPAPKGGRYLRCSRSVAGAECIKKSYKYDVVEKTILSFLETLDIGKILGGDSAPKRLSEKRHSLSMLEIELSSILTKIENTATALSEGASISLAEKLRSFERQQGEKQSEIALIENEIDEILTLDPSKRNEVVAGLMQKIGTDAKVEDRARSRRALAGELHRIIDRMVIRLDVQFAHEVMDSDPDWEIKHKSLSELERYLEDHGFEISIIYRNGAHQIISGAKDRDLKMKSNRKMTDLRLIAKHEG